VKLRNNFNKFKEYFDSNLFADFPRDVSVNDLQQCQQVFEVTSPKIDRDLFIHRSVSRVSSQNRDEMLLWKLTVCLIFSRLVLSQENVFNKASNLFGNFVNIATLGTINYNPNQIVSQPNGNTINRIASPQNNYQNQQFVRPNNYQSNQAFVPSAGQCSNYFSYNNENGETIGIVTIPNPDRVKGILKLALSVAARLSSVRNPWLEEICE